MPNDFTPSVLPEVLLNFDEIFAKNRTDLRSFEIPKTANTLLESQTARMQPIFTGERCTGFSVVYMKSDEDTVGSGVGTEPEAECTITPTKSFSSLKEQYEISRWFQYPYEIPAKDCDNAIKTRNRLSEALSVCMHNIGLELNQYAIEVLLANKQTATNLGNFGININAGVIEYLQSDLLDQQKFQSILNDWYLIAQQEYLSGGVFAINGTNWFTQYRDAVANANNDNQRSQLITFGAIPMTNDIHGFGISRANILASSFLVDPNAYVFMNRHNFANSTPEAVGDDKNTMRWSMPLRYMDGGVARTMMYNLNGTMSPVMVDVEMQRSCNTSASLDGFATFDYLVKMNLTADFGIAPADNSMTGIVQIDAVPA